eukprot:6204525-Pleurochrysis_carterae.AAC.1
MTGRSCLAPSACESASASIARSLTSASRSQTPGSASVEAFGADCAHISSSGCASSSALSSAATSGSALTGDGSTKEPVPRPSQRNGASKWRVSTWTSACISSESTSRGSSRPRRIVSAVLKACSETESDAKAEMQAADWLT